MSFIHGWIFEKPHKIINFLFSFPLLSCLALVHEISTSCHTVVEMIVPMIIETVARIDKWHRVISSKAAPLPMTHVQYPWPVLLVSTFSNMSQKIQITSPTLKRELSLVVGVLQSLPIKHAPRMLVLCYFCRANLQFWTVVEVSLLVLDSSSPATPLVPLLLLLLLFQYFFLLLYYSIIRSMS